MSVCVFTKSHTDGLKKAQILTTYLSNNKLLMGNVDEYIFYVMQPEQADEQNVVTDQRICTYPFFDYFNLKPCNFIAVIILHDFPLYPSNIIKKLLSKINSKILSKNVSCFVSVKYKKLLDFYGFNYGQEFNADKEGYVVMLPQENYISTANTKCVYDIFEDQECASYHSYIDHSFFMYSYIGAYYKSSAILNVVDGYELKNNISDVLDLGSGLCSVGLELLMNLSQYNNNVSLDCVDTPENSQALRFDDQRYGFFLKRMQNLLPLKAGSFCFFDDKIEKFLFKKKYNLVIMIGSLLYLPRSEVMPVLYRIMENLSVGGILCLHENIKNPAYKKDYEIMFTVSELEQYLCQLGNIAYFHPITGAPLKKEEVGNKTVFRIIRKGNE